MKELGGDDSLISLIVPASSNTSSKSNSFDYVKGRDWLSEEGGYYSLLFCYYLDDSSS